MPKRGRLVYFVNSYFKYYSQKNNHKRNQIYLNVFLFDATVYFNISIHISKS